MLCIETVQATVIHGPLKAQGSTSSDGDLQLKHSPVTAVTFHWLKYKLYESIREALATFPLLRLRSPVTLEDLE